MRLDPGYILRSVGGIGVDPSENAPLDSVIAKARSAASDGDEPLHAKVDFVFERPCPALPVHGWARKALRRMKQFRFTEDQKAFLNECFGSSLRGGERIRDKKALQMMKADSRFNGKVDPRSGRSLVLKQSQIRASPSAAGGDSQASCDR